MSADAPNPLIGLAQGLGTDPGPSPLERLHGALQRGAGVPGAPDNGQAANALQKVILALDEFMRYEQDDQDRARGASMLAQAHQMMGRKVGPQKPGGIG